MNDKIIKKIIITCVSVVGILILTLFSYAYFTYRITETPQQVEISSKNLEITFDNSSNVSLSNIEPGDTLTKIVTIRNTGNDTTTYDLLWTTLTNTFIEQKELVYSATCTGEGCFSLSETVIPMSGTNMPIVSNVSINEYVTHVYTFTFTYLNKNYAQTVNHGGSISGTIGADTNRKFEITGTIYPNHFINENDSSDFIPFDPSKNYVIYYNSSIDLNYNIQYYDNSNQLLVSSGIKDYNNSIIPIKVNPSKIKIVFSTSNGTAFNGSMLNWIFLKEVSFSEPSSIDYDNNSLGKAIINEGLITIRPNYVKVPVSQDMYDNPDNTYLTDDPSSGDDTNYVKVNAITNSTKNGYVSLSNVAVENGLYKLPGNSGRFTYVYRGFVNNVVSFAGFTWRVLRINENGSIRLILSNPTDYDDLRAKACTTESDICTHYTYMLEGIETDSLLKTTLDNWYLNHLSDYDNMIDNTYYCNEQSNIGGNQMLYSHLPTYNCSSDSNEYYLKIGLPILADYLFAANSFYGYVANNPLNVHNTYTMTKYATTESLFISSNQNMNYVQLSNITTRYARPVISLKSNTLITGGNGSEETPWVVKTSA